MDRLLKKQNQELAKENPNMNTSEASPAVGTQLESFRQFELSESDIEFLGGHQYSEKAWEMVGRKHGIDPATRKIIDGNNRAYLAAPKRWAPLQDLTAPKILTTENINANPLPKDAQAIRDNLRNRDLTVPTSDETKTEEV